MNHVTDHVLNFSLIIRIPKLNLSKCTLLILWTLFKILTLFPQILINSFYLLCQNLDLFLSFFIHFIVGNMKYDILGGQIEQIVGTIISKP